MGYPKRRFGQHFLHDKNVLNKIVLAISPQKDDRIVEIGPGLGALTTQLLPYLSSLNVVEVDAEVIPELENYCGNSEKLHIHLQDVLKFDFTALSKEEMGSLRVVGNLPYNISTPLIFHLLRQIDCIQDMHFMLQKEVAERIAADIGTKRYGRLTVMVQYFCDIELLFLVSAKAFNPVPKVESAFIKLVPKKTQELTIEGIANLEKIVRQAFMHRRKTIHNSLKSLVSEEQFAMIDIDSNLRAERLTVDDFVKLAKITL